MVKSNVCLSGVVMIQYFGCNTSTSCHRCYRLQWESSKIALWLECNVRLVLHWRRREYRPMTKGWRMLTKALHVAWWWGEGNFTASDICNSPPSIATCYFHYPVSPPFLPNFPSYYFFPVSKILSFLHPYFNLIWFPPLSYRLPALFHKSKYIQSCETSQQE